MRRSMVSAYIPEVSTTPAEWHTRQAEENDAYGQINRQPVERIALEDSTLLAGVPTEEVEASIQRGWAFDGIVAQVCEAYQCRKHAPQLLESESLDYAMDYAASDNAEMLAEEYRIQQAVSDGHY